MQHKTLTPALTLFITAQCALFSAEPVAGTPARHRAPAARASAAVRPAKQIELPPLPAGVEALTFADFFRLPVGPRGLEVTDRIKALDGKRVRVLGYMVKEDLTRCSSCPTQQAKGKRPVPAWMELTVPGRMMLTPMPASVSHSHYGLADDLPPQTLFVTVPERFGELVPFTPGTMLLTGILSVGNKPEQDGRTSVVRLTLDPRPVAPPVSTNLSPTKVQSEEKQAE